MSLIGNLDELGLGEIMQIVSLSRKTGILSLSSRGREGSVFFRQGQVVRASASSCQQSLGEVLIQKGLISLTVLHNALAYQQEHAFRERLGVILITQFGLSAETIEEVAREQIENIIFSLFTWNDGSFTFEVRESVETVDSARLDPLQFMLDQGLNPQFLAMEGSRILDETRNARETAGVSDDTQGDDLDFAFDLVDSDDTPVPSPAPPPRHIVLIDDDGPTLRAIAAHLEQSGFTPHTVSRSEEGLITVDVMYRDGVRPVVLIDLIMPKMDGSGILGGMELLKLLHTNFPDLLLMVMTDYHHSSAEKNIRDLGHIVIMKPRRHEVASVAILSRFVERVSGYIASPVDDPAGVGHHDLFNLGDELRIDMGEWSESLQTADTDRMPGGLTLQQGMLDEFNRASYSGEGLLIMLRFASEFLGRAVVFAVQDRILSGIGQFGLSGNGTERVRSIQLPLAAGSLFDGASASGRAGVCRISPTPLDLHLFSLLGGGTPAEVFVAPLMSGTRLLGFLYGDNLPVSAAITDTDALEQFLIQAGPALEKDLCPPSRTGRSGDSSPWTD